MKTLIVSEKKLRTLRIQEKSFHFTNKFRSSITFLDYKCFQKLFPIVISFSVILIFPESPKKLETICEKYHSPKVCNVL